MRCDVCETRTIKILGRTCSWYSVQLCVLKRRVERGYEDADREVDLAETQQQHHFPQSTIAAICGSQNRAPATRRTRKHVQWRGSLTHDAATRANVVPL